MQRDEPEMGIWYPHFGLVAHPPAGPCWVGTLQPFRTRLQLFRVVVVYPPHVAEVPKIWCVSPEISQRTRPFHPHINVDGSLCTFFVPDGTYDPLAHDISRLVDLTADWLRRHVYYLEFGYWPGAEAPHAAAGVLAELAHHLAAVCVCGSGRLFRDCCRTAYQHAAKVETARRQHSAAESLAQRQTTASLHDLRSRMGVSGYNRMLPGLGPAPYLLAL